MVVGPLRRRPRLVARPQPGGGWFGDPQGHSEASRRGWEHRRGDYDDDRRYSSRQSSRYDEDDDRRYSRRYDDDSDRYSLEHGYGQNRGQGGWFGDPRGHSEAARRGWETRRDDDDDRYSSRGRR